MTAGQRRLRVQRLTPKCLCWIIEAVIYHPAPMENEDAGNLSLYFFLFWPSWIKEHRIKEIASIFMQLCAAEWGPRLRIISI